MGHFGYPLLWVACGMAALVAGGEVLVRGAVALAAAMRVSPLVIGLTVVAFGTSSPELAVSVRAALVGQSDLAAGNVVGSNIANILLILGLSALVVPLVVESRLIRFDVPLMILVSCALWILGRDGAIGRGDGCLMFAGVVGYTTWLILQSRREGARVRAEYREQTPVPTRLTARGMLAQLMVVLAGLALLGVGARWLVGGTVEIARLLGVSELVIGLTIVAVGTSLPELVTSVVASIRGQRDIAVGNVVGSNIFNILCVLGVCGMVAPGGVEVSATALRFDIPIMIAVAVACLPVFFTGNLIARWEGGVFLVYYAAYTAYLVMAATQAAVTRTFGVLIFAFLVPLTVLTLGVGVVRSLRDRQSRSLPG